MNTAPSRAKEKKYIERATSLFEGIKPEIEEKFGISLNDVTVKITDDNTCSGRYEDGSILLSIESLKKGDDNSILRTIVHESAHYWKEKIDPWENIKRDLFHRTIEEGFATYVENEFFPDIAGTVELSKNLSDLIVSSTSNGLFELIACEFSKDGDSEKQKKKTASIVSRARQINYNPYISGYVFFKSVGTFFGMGKIIDIIKNPDSVSYAELLYPPFYLFRNYYGSGEKTKQGAEILEEKIMKKLRSTYAMQHSCLVLSASIFPLVSFFAGYFLKSNNLYNEYVHINPCIWTSVAILGSSKLLTKTNYFNKRVKELTYTELAIQAAKNHSIKNIE